MVKININVALYQEGEININVKIQYSNIITIDLKERSNCLTNTSVLTKQTHDLAICLIKCVFYD